MSTEIQKLLKDATDRVERTEHPVVIDDIYVQGRTAHHSLIEMLTAAYEAGRMAGKEEAREPVANRLGLHAMYGNHTFHRFRNVTSPDDLIQKWLDMGGGYEKDITLCPVTVHCGKQELRRVGQMLFQADDKDAIGRFRDALMADPDVVRLMAQSKEAGE